MLFRIITYVCILLISFAFNSAIVAATAKNNFNKQSLDFIVKKTLQQNPSILIRKSRKKAADTAIKLAKGGFFPKVTSSFQTGRSNTKTRSQYSKDHTALNPLSANISVTQPIFSGFGTYNLVKQRKEEFKKASFDEKTAKEDLGFQAVIAYFNVLRFEKLRLLAIKNINIHRKILNKVTKKYKKGAGSKTDVDLAAGRLSQKIARLHNIEGSKEESIANFIETVGIAPRNLFVPTKIPWIPESLGLAINKALENNPVYFSALAAFNAADKAISVSKADLMPKINLQVTRSFNNNATGNEYRYNDTRGMVVAQYNLFNGAIDYNKIKIAKQNKRSAIHNLRNVKNKMIERTTNAWNKIKTDKESLDEYRKYEKSSKKALYGYKKKFELGRSSLLNVLDIENEVFNTEVNVITSEFNLLADHYLLLANMGLLAKYFE